MNRRTAIFALGATAFGIAGGFSLRRSETSGTALAATDVHKKIMRSEAEWREILTPEQYYILREEGTERAGTSPLDNEKRAGIFHCAGCDLDLYSSEAKYDSGTGWPSFFAPIAEDRIGTSTDYKLVYPRTEVHCARCDGHLGHIFSDGPKPTGKRHCLNGLALTFKAA